MSENDNQLKADGKNEVESQETTPTQDATLKVEIETKVKVETEAKKETIKTDSEIEKIEVKTEPKTNVVEAETEIALEETAEVEVETDESKKTEEDETKTKTAAEDHVDEIEASNAEDAEDESNAERHELEDKDYHVMSIDRLVTEFNTLLKHHKIQTISKHVNEIKGEFNSKFSALLDEKKEEFVNDGGNEIDFYYTNDTKKLFNTLYKEYKQSINAYYKEREQNLKQNLESRLEIIENIKGLLNVEENMGTTYKTFKELQEKWRNAGPIPRDKYNNAWNTYHHHVERFYDFLHLNNDLRDMDFKHNYEQKLKIIERAEELAKDENTNRSFRELQVLHKLWKEELGPVGKEHREQIWERFSKSTKTIHGSRKKS